MFSSFSIYRNSERYNTPGKFKLKEAFSIGQTYQEVRGQGSPRIMERRKGKG